MLTYLIELSAYWAAFLGLYLLVLRREKLPHLNRAYLLLGLPMSALLPLISWSTILPRSEVTGLPTIILEQVNVLAASAAAGAETVAPPWLTWAIVLKGIFLVGCGLALLRLVNSLRKMYKQVKYGRKVWEGNVCWVFTEATHSPYSWMHFLFWSDRLSLTPEEKQTIVAHELAHIRQKHSWDILVYELLHVLLWWHPLWYINRRELEQVHEYLADAEALLTTSRKQYGQLLVRQSLQQPALALVQHFHTSQLKNRITMMMKSPGTTRAMTKYLLLIPVLALIVLACNTDESQQEVDAIGQKAEEEANEPEVTFYELSDTIVMFDPASGEENSAVVKTKVYNYVDKMPIYGYCPGLTDDELEQCSNMNLLEAIYTNVTYPESARVAEQEGMALLEFVVGTDGKIFNLQTVAEKTTEHSALNEAALAAARQLNEFEPGVHEGKPVSVRLVLPIKFKLE